jgi:hypothetical protein
MAHKSPRLDFTGVMGLIDGSRSITQCLDELRFDFDGSILVRISQLLDVTILLTFTSVDCCQPSLGMFLVLLYDFLQ